MQLFLFPLAREREHAVDLGQTILHLPDVEARYRIVDRALRVDDVVTGSKKVLGSFQCFLVQRRRDIGE